LGGWKRRLSAPTAKRRRPMNGRAPWFGLNINPGNMAPPRNLPAARLGVGFIGISGPIGVSASSDFGDSAGY
jgi:hypothetical protein